jgi:hypothetical protein
MFQTNDLAGLVSIRRALPSDKQVCRRKAVLLGIAVSASKQKPVLSKPAMKRKLTKKQIQAKRKAQKNSSTSRSFSCALLKTKGVTKYKGTKIEHLKNKEYIHAINQTFGLKISTKHWGKLPFVFYDIKPDYQRVHGKRNGHAFWFGPKLNQKSSDHYLMYKSYLTSPEWASIRNDLFALRGEKCERCGSSCYLQVHHLTYDRLFKELPEDLEILCAGCHKAEHKIK